MNRSSRVLHHKVLHNQNNTLYCTLNLKPSSIDLIDIDTSDNSSTLVAMDCGHVFHFQCLKGMRSSRALDKNLNKYLRTIKCPTCNKSNWFPNNKLILAPVDNMPKDPAIVQKQIYKISTLLEDLCSDKNAIGVFKATEDKNTDLMSKNNILAEQNRVLRKSNESLNTKYNRLIYEKMLLEKDYSDLDVRANGLISENISLAKQNRFLTKSNESLNTKYNRLNNEKMSLGKNYSDSVVQANKLMSKKDILVEQNRVLTKSNESLNTKYNRLINENISLRKNYSDSVVRANEFRQDSNDTLEDIWIKCAPKLLFLRILKILCALK